MIAIGRPEGKNLFIENLCETYSNKKKKKNQTYLVLPILMEIELQIISNIMIHLCP